MEYMYAAMLLHKAGNEINESNLSKVLEAAGVKADKAKITVVVNALKGVDIEKVIAEAVIAPVAAPAASEAPKAEAKESHHKEEKKDDTAAAAGLGALFG